MTTFDELLKIVDEDQKFTRLMNALGPKLPDKKTYRDYSIGLHANLKHIERYLPSVLKGGLRILDVGPGIGCFMHIARHFGNEVIGSDLPKSVPSVRTYSKILEHWNLEVLHLGFQRYLADEGEPPKGFDLIHFRGSLDAIMSGITQGTSDLMSLCFDLLNPKGRVWIGHNQDQFSQHLERLIQRDPKPLTLDSSSKWESRLHR
jgi:cyclopropane fatty-acyl-phospholipid synthase-like methyltransferase